MSYAAFTRLSFTTPQIGLMAALVDVDGLTVEEAGKKWLVDNEAIWKPWTATTLGHGN